MERIATPGIGYRDQHGGYSRQYDSRHDTGTETTTPARAENTNTLAIAPRRRVAFIMAISPPLIAAIDTAMPIIAKCSVWLPHVNENSLTNGLMMIQNKKLLIKLFLKVVLIILNNN